MSAGSLEPNFRKSSYSATANDCVEVADLGGDTAVRDSQNPDAGLLRLPSSEWVFLLRAAAPS
ncbi:DUF397 domain-containing protein [Nocardiopsis changdeensis]|uniref:DUF397 domain-containing protein n=1 Tax=Nocardiopsis changdeensis TaxID=2831969 RepID=A0ABX8BF25_9ACTN|nr:MULTISPECIES: DUF397 domain-containing protein [Nocardiopsis]QUX20851.1 DUF397 domain-containing protein [Nocardiopsis changdeensis]QYX36783.1 DUF397 domain-containing protein [Nocardiopsis sp. MT53]